MNIEITEAEILFKQPVKLNGNIELVDFHTKTKELSHLLVINDRRYHLNKSSYNLIKIIENNDTLDGIAKEYSKVENNEYSINDIILAINTLLAKNGIVETIEPLKFKSKNHSLFFKTTLFSVKTLQPITKLLQHLFNPNLAKFSIFIIIFANYFVFANYFSYKTLNGLIDSPLTLLLSLLIFTFSGFFHEFGHVSACRYFGAKHGEIGWAIYLRFPVLYSQISDTWRLIGWQRAIIDIAGIYFQFIFNIILFILFLLTKERVFIYAFQIICIQSIFTLNPFLKFDGYWLATDLLGVPNLRKRSYEIFEYFFAKYVIKTRKLKQPYFLLMESKYMYAFIIYALTSNAFLIYFMATMFYILPGMLQTFPSEFQTSFSLIIQKLSFHLYLEFFTDVFKLLIKSFILGISLYFSIRMLMFFYRTIKKNILLVKE